MCTIVEITCGRNLLSIIHIDFPVTGHDRMEFLTFENGTVFLAVPLFVAIEWILNYDLGIDSKNYYIQAFRFSYKGWLFQ